MSSESAGERTSYDVDEAGVALLRLERPEARNAIDTAMLEELLEHLAAAREDEEVRVLVVSSSDQMGLSAGADVKEKLDEQGKVRRMQLFADLYDAIVAFPKPTVAVCHGDVVGGGAEIAVACDLRVGGANLRLRFPGAALGVPVGPARLVTLCGLAAAKYLLFTSRTVGIDEALSPRPRQPRRADRDDRGGRPRPGRERRRPPARGGRPPEAHAARVGRRRGAVAGRGCGPGRVGPHRPRAAATGLSPAGSDSQMKD